MKILVKTINNSSFEFEVENNISILDLKILIGNELNISILQINLIYNGKILEKGTLSDFNIQDGSTLILHKKKIPQIQNTNNAPEPKLSIVNNDEPIPKYDNLFKMSEDYEKVKGEKMVLLYNIVIDIINRKKNEIINEIRNHSEVAQANVADKNVIENLLNEDNIINNILNVGSISLIINTNFAECMEQMLEKDYEW